MGIEPVHALDFTAKTCIIRLVNIFVGSPLAGSPAEYNSGFYPVGVPCSNGANRQESHFYRCDVDNGPALRRRGFPVTHICRRTL